MLEKSLRIIGAEQLGPGALDLQVLQMRCAQAGDARRQPTHAKNLAITGVIVMSTLSRNQTSNKNPRISEASETRNPKRSYLTFEKKLAHDFFRPNRNGTSTRKHPNRAGRRTS